MRAPEFQPVENRGNDWAPAGESPREWRAGDIVLTHGDSLFAKLIGFGQRLRIHGEDRKYAWFTHAALVAGPGGELVEVMGSGIKRRHVSVYRPQDYAVVHTGAEPGDVKEILRFADWAVAARPKYGWATIVSIALTMLTGAKFAFFVSGEFICSGFVARAMERTGAIFSRDPVHITPADLAKYYGVLPPSTR